MILIFRMPFDIEGGDMARAIFESKRGGEM